MGEIDLARVICAVHELPDPGAKSFTIGEGEWPLRGFVVRRGETVRAYVNHCPHAGFPLNWSPDQFLAPGGALILCVMHGALFEIGSGHCVSGPCAGHGLQPLTVHVRSGYVLLDDAIPLVDPN
jgi:nitrite reductase/ring-hydroxylating ferredoxin subunit